MANIIESWRLSQFKILDLRILSQFSNKKSNQFRIQS